MDLKHLSLDTYIYKLFIVNVGKKGRVIAFAKSKTFKEKFGYRVNYKKQEVASVQ